MRDPVLFKQEQLLRRAGLPRRQVNVAEIRRAAPAGDRRGSKEAIGEARSESAALLCTLRAVSPAARFGLGGLFALALVRASAAAVFAGVEVLAEVIPVVRAVEADALAAADTPRGVEAHEVVHVVVAVVAELLVAVVVGSFHGVLLAVWVLRGLALPGGTPR